MIRAIATTVFARGQQAYLDGKPISANPYAGPAGADWLAGWRTEQLDLRDLRK